jgi:hypothetical protein
MDRDIDDASTIVVSTTAESPSRVVDKGKGVELAPMAETEEVTKLAPALPPTSAPVVPTGSSISYETAPSMEALRLRQFQEDMEAYKIDLNFAQNVLTNPDLSPPEERTWQLRILDVSHRIRYCTHQVDIIRFEQRSRTAVPTRHASSSGMQSKAKSVLKRPAPADDKGEDAAAKRVKLTAKPTTGTSTSTPKPIPGSSKAPDGEELPGYSDTEDQPAGSRLQRLGFWECRLCKSTKYIAAKTRDPAEPCKWPLKDMYKLIHHYLGKHTEHTPQERCRELGDALEKNLGPFEHWLATIKKQDVGDGQIVIEIMEKLKKGEVDDLLRKLHKTAGDFPQ